jgi:hypothetical protein
MKAAFRPRPERADGRIGSLRLMISRCQTSRCWAPGAADRDRRQHQEPAPRASPVDGADPWQAADLERTCRWCRRLTRSGLEAQALRLADLHGQGSQGGCRSARGRWRGCRPGCPPLPGVPLQRPQAREKITMRTGSLVHTLWRFLIMTRCSYSDVTLTRPTHF